MRPEEAAAAYLATLTKEMVKIAVEAGLRELAYIYAMAELQAEIIAKQANASPSTSAPQ